MCHITYQIQAFVTKIILSYDIIGKECDTGFHMIYYLCFYALSILSYADQKKL